MNKNYFYEHNQKLHSDHSERTRRHEGQSQPYRHQYLFGNASQSELIKRKRTVLDEPGANREVGG